MKRNLKIITVMVFLTCAVFLSAQIFSEKPAWTEDDPYYADGVVYGVGSANYASNQRLSMNMARVQAQKAMILLAADKLQEIFGVLAPDVEADQAAVDGYVAEALRVARQVDLPVSYRLDYFEITGQTVWVKAAVAGDDLVNALGRDMARVTVPLVEPASRPGPEAMVAGDPGEASAAESEESPASVAADPVSVRTSRPQWAVDLGEKALERLLLDIFNAVADQGRPESTEDA